MCYISSPSGCDTTVGTCSICGGRVVVYSFTVDPQPTCTKCGAVAKKSFGPVIDMQPKWPNKIGPLFPTPQKYWKHIDAREFFQKRINEQNQ